jgi:hypothetical protein
MPVPARGGFQAWAGFLDANGQAIVPRWAQAGIAGIPFGIGGLIISIARAPFRTADFLISMLPPVAGCSIQSARTIGLWSITVGWLNWLTKDGFKPAVEAIRRQSNYNCPYDTIDGADAVQLTLRQRLTYDEGEGWAAADGWCPPTFQQRYWLAQRRLVESDLIEQYHRQTITHDQCVQGLIARGVADAATANALIELSYRLLPEQTILEAVHRLRPGRDPSGLTYTQQQALTDLQKHGYTQQTAQILLTLSYRPPPVRVLQTAYAQGKLQRADLEQFEQDNAWSDSTISALAPEQDFKRSTTLAALQGVPKPESLAKDLAAGTRTISDVVSDMQRAGFQQSDIAITLSAAQQQRAADMRAATIASIRGSLNSGSTTPEEAAIALSAAGVDSSEAGEIVALWAIERSARSKPVGLSQLCEYAGRGWISVTEYGRRLSLMGYGQRDVRMIIEACGLKDLQRRQKQIDASARRAGAGARERIAAARAAAGQARTDARAAASQAAHETGTAKTVAGAVKSRQKKGSSKASKPQPTTGGTAAYPAGGSPTYVGPAGEPTLSPSTVSGSVGTGPSASTAAGQSLYQPQQPPPTEIPPQ